MTSPYTEIDDQNVTEASAKIPSKTSNKLNQSSNTSNRTFAHASFGGHKNGVFYFNESVPNNCLYNNVIFSTNDRYYVQVKIDL
jgi:hypothetical protein